MPVHGESSSERAAAVLGDVLAGTAPKDQATRNLVRQLCRRMERWVATRPLDAATWRSLSNGPPPTRPLLADMLQRLVADDAGARHLVELLAPSEPEAPPCRISYEDFVVAFESAASGEGISARLLATPHGRRCCVPLDLSFCAGNPRWLVETLAHQLAKSRDVRRREAAASPPPSAAELGRSLSRALFVAGLREAWVASSGLLVGRLDLGLRLRLVFDLGGLALSAAAALPWELLRDPLTDQPLCKDLRTPLVRSLETSTAAVTALDPTAHRRAGILLVRSQPRDQLHLDLATESQAIEAAWRAVPGVRVEGAVADLDELRQLLRARPFTVLHFMGHGDFDRRSNAGIVVFEDAAGRSLEITASALAEQLSGLPLQLVVLSSCRSGELPRTAGVDPFSGVASSLVRAGTPAVLAMQFPISDDAAIVFGRQLYRRLATGDCLEAAVTEGRLAISRHDPESWEWTTPVLYLQGDGLRLR